MRPRLLDLFCGAGGAAWGYRLAGLDVVGVDLWPQPNYPFPLLQGDALDLLGDLLATGNFVAVHASPPCQAYSSLVTMRTDQRDNREHEHPDLVEPTRDALQATGLPYVIENVPGAPLIDPVQICGSAVGLPIVDCEDQPRQVRRHRLFETNWPLRVPPCRHTVPALGTYGNGGRWKRTDGGVGRRGGYQGSIDENRDGMGIDWLTSRYELGQAIPPAYTELIGAQLLAYLEGDDFVDALVAGWADAERRAAR